MKTLEEKLKALKERSDGEDVLNKKIDRLMRSVDSGEEETPRCGLCSNIFGARRKIKMHKTVEMAGVSDEAAQKSRTLFGKKKVSDPSAKLREAAVALEERVAQLEERVAEGRSEAKRMMGMGKKAAALRALKKTKAVEKQMLANQASLDALEVQLSLLEDAAVQKTLASALASSSKGIKSQRKMISRAESAIDDAGEARDMVVELQDVMTEFHTNGLSHDDDTELIAELENMLDDAPTHLVQASLVDPEEIAQEEARRIEEKHAGWDAAEQARRDMPAAPSGLRRKKEERQTLLINNS
jgi:5'-3' exonuclease